MPNSRLFCASLAGLLSLLLVSPNVRSQQPPQKSKLAVLDLGDKGVGAEVASLLTGVVSNKLTEIGIFEVISREDIKNMLTHEQDKILVGCSDTSCLSEIGGALGVENLIAGEVGLVGQKYVINLQRIDIRNAKVVKRAERQFKGSRERLLEEVANATYKVVEDILEARSGTVLLSVSEEGADISVDGKTIGVSPMDKLSLPAGPRDFRISKKGFIFWARTVQVKPGDIQMVEASLIPSASFIEEYESSASSMRTWAWIALGTFLACEATAVGLRTYTYLEYDPLEDEYNSKDFEQTHDISREEFYHLYKSDMDRAEIMDYSALGLGIAGVIAGALSLYLFMEGDDPSRYEKFRGVKGAVPAAGGGLLELVWEF
jgi:hypothetical protein